MAVLGAFGNWLSRLGGSKANEVVEAGAYGAMSLGRERKPRAWSKAEAVSAPSLSAVVAACLGAWLVEYPSAPFLVKNADDEPMYEHPVLELLDNPAPYIDGVEYAVLHCMYQVLTGTALVYIVRNSVGVPVGLDLFDGMNSSVVSTKTERVRAYKVQTPHGGVSLDPNDVIRLPWFVRSTSEPLFGLPPIQSAFAEHAQYRELAEFVGEYLANRATPGAVIANKSQGMTPERVRADREDFERKFGPGNRGRLAYVVGDISVSSFSHGLKDLDIRSAGAISEANICAAFKVPPEYVGVTAGLQNSTYSNVETARDKFVVNTVSSMWRANARAIGRKLLGELGEKGERLVFDTSDVPSMREDTKERAEVSTSLFVAGGITLNEYRSANNYEPVEGGDVIRNQGGDEPAAKSVVAKRRVKFADGLTWVEPSEEEIAAYWKSTDDGITAAVEPLQRALVAVVGEVAKRVEEHAAKAAAAGKTKNATASLGMTTEELRKLFLEGTTEARASLVSELVNKAGDDVQAALADLAGEIDKALRDTFATSDDRVGKAADTFAEELQAAIESGELDPVKIADAITATATAAAVRMATVARTTGTAANSTAQNTVWQVVNKTDPERVIHKRWVSMRDVRVRDSHRTADGVILPNSGVFVVGADTMPGPGLGSLAEENINCRCVLYPVVKKRKT